MNKQKSVLLVLFLLCFFSVGLTHFLNHSKLSEVAPEVLNHNITVLTFDDASYLAPAENFVAGNGWKSNASGKAAITTRSPGYGLLYAGFRVLFPVQQALLALVVFQLLLFAVSVALIPRIGVLSGFSFRLSFIMAVCIAVLPTFSGFISYTLTEAITPSLVLLFLYFFLLFQKTGKGWIVAALILGYLILVRPPMIVWVFAVFTPLVLHFREMGFNKLLGLVAISLLPIFIWQVSISIKTDQIQSLHPVYLNDNNDLYRPLHRDIWDFHKSWGQTGAAFNATVNQLWADAIHNRDPQRSISAILESSDRNVINLIGKDKLESAYLSYFKILKRQVPYANNHAPLPGISDAERQLSKTFEGFRREYTSNYWLYSNIAVPAKVYVQLGCHSNLSLYIFQKVWRGNIFMEIFRYFSVLVHFGIFFCFPVALILMRKSVLWLSVSIPIIIYLGYLCIVQRGVEERYTLPVLIPMLLVVAGAVQNLFAHGRMHFRNRGKNQIS